MANYSAKLTKDKYGQIMTNRPFFNFENWQIYDGYYRICGCEIEDQPDQYSISITYYYDYKRNPIPRTHYCIFSFFINKNNSRGTIFGSQSYVNDALIAEINKSKIYYFSSPEIKDELDKYCNDYKYRMRFTDKHKKLNICNVDDTVDIVIAILVINRLVATGELKNLLSTEV